MTMAMAKIQFLTFYLEYSIGIHLLSSILHEAGYHISIIYFKLPSKAQIDWFKDSPINVEHIDMKGDIIGHNADINRWTPNEISLLVDTIKNYSPDVLCISTRSTDEEIVKDVLPVIKSQINTLILAGGYGPTLDPELYYDLVDYVYIGEAENAILEIIDCINDKQSIDNIENIAYKKNGTVRRNKLREPTIKNFNPKKVPDENVIFIENERIYHKDKHYKIINTHTYSTFFGRGCISSCSYCSAGQWDKIYQREGYKIKKRRNRLIEEIITELIELKKTDCTFVHFRDEFLCATKNQLKTFFKLYEENIHLPFWAYLVPDQILTQPELLEMAVDAGFVDTEIGFQTGSDRINRKIYNRYISNRKSVKYAKLLSSFNINIKYDFILFNPIETFEDAKETIDLIQSLPKSRSYLQLSRLHYFPCSPIVETLKSINFPPNFIEYNYCIALLYLLSFVLPHDEMNNLLSDSQNNMSKTFLLNKYKSYIAEHNLSFPVGTHDVPDSITTHRYKRIIEKNSYKEIAVWIDNDYFQKMKSAFNSVAKIHYFSDNESVVLEWEKVMKPSALKNQAKDIPLFICSKRKQQIKKYIVENFSGLEEQLYV